MKHLLYSALLLLILTACNTNKQNHNSTSDATASEVETEQPVASTEASSELPSKTMAYSWSTGMCDYEGTYNSNLFTEEQFNNTINYFINYGMHLNTVSVFNPDDIERIDLDELKTETDKILHDLRNLEFVSTPYFDSIKQVAINCIERDYIVTKLQYNIFLGETDELLQDNYAATECRNYTDAIIAGGDELLSAWGEMAINRKNNGNNTAWEEYLEQSASSEKELYALIHITTFGWGNCMNNSILRIDPYDANEEFAQLFSELEKECESP